MITAELQKTLDVPGDGRRDVPRPAGVPGGVRGGHGSTARLAPAAPARGAAVSPARFRLRRVVAGAGLALASAVVVFGLGLLADVSTAANGAPAEPVTVVRGF